jgi:hypothetical protein
VAATGARAASSTAIIPAEAVPDHDWFLDTRLRAERREVVGEVADVVAAFRAVALSATA